MLPTIDMKHPIIVRQTVQADYTTVYNLIKTAFETAEHRDGTEQDYAVGLRDGDNYIPELDLVAELDGELIGHIMLTRTHVTLPDGSRYDTLLVAPLSVLLEHRSSGVGSALMREGLRIAKAMGHSSAFLIGDPNYYCRFGFELAEKYSIRHESLPAEYVQAAALHPGALHGITGLIAM